MIRKIVLLGLLVLFWGCTTHKKKSRSASKTEATLPERPEFPAIHTDDVFVYECTESIQFSALVKKDSAWLFLPDTSLKTMKVSSGSGAKYQGAGYLYWSKGDEALFQMPTGSLMNCTSISREKSWEAAKIRGIDFRALGQEPGWTLEITRGKHISYIGNYGQDTLLTPVPKSEVTDNPTVYKVEADAHTLIVKIADQPCIDSMSGFRFPSTVAITVDGETYHGCGRSLH